MNVTVNSQLLATELRLLNKVIPAKPAIAILSHMLLRVDDAGLHFWATDLEIGLSSGCPADVTEPGVTVLPVAKFLALVEQFPDDDVTIATDKDFALVKCGAFKSRIQTMPVDEFPSPPRVEGESSSLNGNALLRLIAKTRYAVSASGAKYVLKGALLTLTGPVAAMVATDAKRLAIATASRTGSDFRCVIPMKALDMLVVHVREDCQVTVEPRYLSFTSGGRLLISRAFNEEFPNYERIIPRDNNLIVTVSRATLLAALNRVNIIAETNRAVYFTITPGKLTLSATSVEVGSADEDVPVDYDGSPLKICINGNYVLDFLNASSESKITIALKDVKSPALFSDGPNHVAAIMLLRF